ncbi:hypothetical protein HFV02_01875 [Acidithiobacillus caldus]|nr:hypothetical protein [Acidithiobacillus caldus]
MNEEKLAAPPGTIMSKPSGRFTPPSSQIYANAMNVAVTNFDITINFGRNAIETSEDGTSAGYILGLVGVTLSPAFARVLRDQLTSAIAMQESMSAAPPVSHG